MAVWTLTVATPLAVQAQSKEILSVAVLPFDLVDYSADQRPRIVQEQKRWAARLTRRVRQEISRTKEYRIVDNTPAKPLIDKLQAGYAHPSECPSCALEIGQRLHADRILIGQIRKMSSLIVFLQITVVDVPTEKTIYTRGVEIKGNNYAMWSRAAQTLLQDLESSPGSTARPEDQGNAD